MSRGEPEAAISHLSEAFEIASSLNLRNDQVTILRTLVQLLLGKGRFDGAQVHLNRLKSFVADDPFNLGLTMGMQAIAWAVQGRFGEARSELLRIVSMYEELGVSAGFLEPSQEFL